MVVDVKRVNDRLMMIKLLIGIRVVAIVSTYPPQQGLGEDEKDTFYEDLITLVSNINKDNLVVIG